MREVSYDAVPSLAYRPASSLVYRPQRRPETPQDMADLVEYLYGNASTTWGRLRINDGHPETYETRFFELGCAHVRACARGARAGGARGAAAGTSLGSAVVRPLSS